MVDIGGVIGVEGEVMACDGGVEGHGGLCRVDIFCCCYYAGPGVGVGDVRSIEDRGRGWL